MKLFFFIGSAVLVRLKMQSLLEILQNVLPTLKSIFLYYPREEALWLPLDLIKLQSNIRGL